MLVTHSQVTWGFHCVFRLFDCLPLPLSATSVLSHSHSLSLTLSPSPSHSLPLLCWRLMMPLLRDVRCQVATASNCSIWLVFCLFFMNCGILIVMTAASQSRSPTAAVSAALSATATATPAVSAQSVDAPHFPAKLLAENCRKLQGE